MPIRSGRARWCRQTGQILGPVGDGSRVDVARAPVLWRFRSGTEGGADLPTPRHNHQRAIQSCSGHPRLSRTSPMVIAVSNGSIVAGPHSRYPEESVSIIWSGVSRGPRCCRYGTDRRGDAAVLMATGRGCERQHLRRPGRAGGAGNGACKGQGGRALPSRASLTGASTLIPRRASTANRARVD